eukprot:TRINITY_DN509_c0_g1_i1.p1 TRINITY_DN509_c0_g1~~TRINITY_DN509_c0_g1_i1.p1  ORF type:complete len:408 (+),score=86.88 TRINITY_DN509_c0_g1_i1:41-1264(+)
MLLAFAALAAAAKLVPTTTKTNVPKINKFNEELIFNDEFETFDFSKWKHELTMGGGGNWEFQQYTNSRKNSFVRDGVLYLKPSFTAEIIGEDAVYGRNPNWEDNTIDMWGSSPANQCTGAQWYGCFRTGTYENILNPVQSARLRTAETFSFRYGRVEVRARLPRGDWLWPAIWMLPVNAEYGEWPASGEIDIMESRGNGPECTKDGKPLGDNSYGATAHWGPMYGKNGFPMTNDYHVLPNGERYSDDFHVFGLYWSDYMLYLYLDDPSNVVMNITWYGTEDFWSVGSSNGYWPATDMNPWEGSSIIAPFDREYNLVMNVAVGGTAGESDGYFPDGACNKPWSNVEPSPARRFYDAKPQWLPTWQDATSGNGQYAVGDSAALKVDYVRVWGIPGTTTYTDRIPAKFSV